VFCGNVQRLRQRHNVPSADVPPALDVGNRGLRQAGKYPKLYLGKPHRLARSPYTRTQAIYFAVSAVIRLTSRTARAII
jgi:hypothetical protein